MCELAKLKGKFYQFDGFSFYNSIEPKNCWSEHCHEEIQILLPGANAKATIGYQSSTGKAIARTIEADRCCLIAPNRVHALDWQQEAGLTLFYLHPRFLANAVDRSIKSGRLNLDTCFIPLNDGVIRQMGTIFRQLCHLNTDEAKLYAKELAHLLAIHLSEKYFVRNTKTFSSPKKLSTEKLNLISEYIDANLERKITLSDLAAVAGIGKFYFSRLFKSSIGCSPYTYVLRRRIEKAKKLLRYSNISICEIALECGFSNQSHLAKHFRRISGTTPASYRQSVSWH